MKIGGKILTNSLELSIDPSNPKSFPDGPPTVNLFDSTDFTTGWSAPTHTTASAPDGTNTAALFEMTTTNMQLGRYTYYFPENSYNKKYALSFWCKGLNNFEETGVQVEFLNYSQSYNGNPTIISGTRDYSNKLQTGEWEKVEIVTHFDDITNDVNLSFTSIRIGRDTNIINTGSKFLIWQPQWEEKSSPTLFTENSRSVWYNNLSSDLNLNIIGNQLEKIDNYMHFSGSYISQAGIYNYDQTSTIDIWFKANATGKFPIAGYDMNTGGGGFSSTVAGMIYRNGAILSFAVITSESGYRFANCVPNFDEIINAVAVKNMETGLIKIYLNGVLQNSTSFDTGSFANWFDPPQDMASENIFSIGHTNSNHTSWEGSDFNLYSLRLYSRELSSAEIKNNYNNLKGKY